MGLEVRVYVGLTKTLGVETDANSYPRDLKRYWFEDVVESTDNISTGHTLRTQTLIRELVNQRGRSITDAASTDLANQWRGRRGSR